MKVNRSLADRGHAAWRAGLMGRCSGRIAWVLEII
jgi:hypothetical protein